MSTRDEAVGHHLRRGAAIAALVAAAWGLAGCTSGSSDSSGAASAYAEDGSAAGADSAEAAVDESASDGGAGEVAGDGRSYIVTGAMYMTVEDPVAAADRVEDIVQGLGGRVDARSETAATEHDGGSAWLTLRIPSGDLDAAVNDLRALGTVDEYSTDSADVTTEVRDLEARISTLEASTARIEGFLAEAESIKDIITLEDELDSRQAELESLVAQQRGLTDQVSLSTIELSLTTAPVVRIEEPAPQTFWSGLESGASALGTFLSGTLVIFGVLLPWLTAAGIIAAVTLVVVRARRARAAQRTAASSPPEEAAPAGAGLHAED